MVITPVLHTGGRRFDPGLDHSMLLSSFLSWVSWSWAHVTVRPPRYCTTTTTTKHLLSCSPNGLLYLGLSDVLPQLAGRDPFKRLCDSIFTQRPDGRESRPPRQANVSCTPYCAFMTIDRQADDRMGNIHDAQLVCRKPS